MDFYAKYACNYRLPEYHNVGYCNNEVYLEVNSAGLYDKRVPLNITNRPSGRKDYFLLYNYSGTAHVRFANETAQVNDGQILIFRPKEPQCYWYENDGRTKSYWVHFTGYGAEELLTMAGLGDVHIRSVGIIPEICEYMESIIDEIGNKRAGYELVVLSIFTRVLATISRIIKEDLPPNIRSRNSRIYETLAYIRNNISDRINIKDLAAMCFLSANRYSTIFKELIGVSPQQYIINCKMQKAIYYMHYTDMSIGEISKSLGFNDQMYFSRLFKKHMHISPSQFISKYCMSGNMSKIQSSSETEIKE